LPQRKESFTSNVTSLQSFSASAKEGFFWLCPGQALLSALLPWSLVLRQVLYKEQKCISHSAGGWEVQEQGAGSGSPSCCALMWQKADESKPSPENPFHCYYFLDWSLEVISMRAFHKGGALITS
jgi:hypothetical protein